MGGSLERGAVSNVAWRSLDALVVDPGDGGGVAVDGEAYEVGHGGERSAGGAGGSTDARYGAAGELTGSHRVGLPGGCRGRPQPFGIHP